MDFISFLHSLDWIFTAYPLRSHKCPQNGCKSPPNQDTHFVLVSMTTQGEGIENQAFCLSQSICQYQHTPVHTFNRPSAGENLSNSSITSLYPLLAALSKAVVPSFIGERKKRV